MYQSHWQSGNRFTAAKPRHRFVNGVYHAKIWMFIGARIRYFESELSFVFFPIMSPNLPPVNLSPLSESMDSVLNRLPRPNMASLGNDPPPGGRFGLPCGRLLHSFRQIRCHK